MVWQPAAEQMDTVGALAQHDGSPCGAQARNPEASSPPAAEAAAAAPGALSAGAPVAGTRSAESPTAAAAESPAAAAAAAAAAETPQEEEQEEDEGEQTQSGSQAKEGAGGGGSPGPCGSGVLGSALGPTVTFSQRPRGSRSPACASLQVQVSLPLDEAGKPSLGAAARQVHLVMVGSRGELAAARELAAVWRHLLCSSPEAGWHAHRAALAARYEEQEPRLVQRLRLAGDLGSLRGLMKELRGSGELRRLAASVAIDQTLHMGAAAAAVAAAAAAAAAGGMGQLGGDASPWLPTPEQLPLQAQQAQQQLARPEGAGSLDGAGRAAAAAGYIKAEDQHAQQGQHGAADLGAAWPPAGPGCDPPRLPLLTIRSRPVEAAQPPAPLPGGTALDHMAWLASQACSSAQQNGSEGGGGARAAALGLLPGGAAAAAGWAGAAAGGQPGSAAFGQHAELWAKTDAAGRPGGEGGRARTWKLILCNSPAELAAARGLGLAWRGLHCPSARREAAQRDRELLQRCEAVAPAVVQRLQVAGAVAQLRGVLQELRDNGQLEQLGLSMLSPAGEPALLAPPAAFAMLPREGQQQQLGGDSDEVGAGGPGGLNPAAASGGGRGGRKRPAGTAAEEREVASNSKRPAVMLGLPGGAPGAPGQPALGGPAAAGAAASVPDAAAASNGGSSSSTLVRRLMALCADSQATAAGLTPSAVGGFMAAYSGRFTAQQRREADEWLGVLLEGRQFEAAGAYMAGMVRACGM